MRLGRYLVFDMDLSTSFRAEEGPLSSVGRDFPSIFSLQQTQAKNVASKLEVNFVILRCFFYFPVTMLLVNVIVRATVWYSTRGVSFLLKIELQGPKIFGKNV